MNTFAFCKPSALIKQSQLVKKHANAQTTPRLSLIKRSQGFRIRAEEEDTAASSSQTTPPSTPSPQEEEPVWVRRERERELIEKEGKDLPFGAYLLFSSFVCIAAVGSIFEWTGKHPIFDVIPPENPLYTPILGFFAITGFPTSAFLFFKAVEAANKEAERMDKLDGYK